MSPEHMSLVGLSITLLGTLSVSTWRFSALASKLLAAVQKLEEKEREQDSRIKALDDIPAIRVELGHLTKNHSLIPRLESRISVLEASAQHSKEIRALQLRRSRPEFTPDE